MKRRADCFRRMSCQDGSDSTTIKHEDTEEEQTG